MQVGDLVSGKYRLLRALGAGGMGSVWGARNELTNRDFAIKFLRPELAQNRESLQRFFNEARACGQIKHAAVVEVYDMGQAEDGAPYLVMELLEGEGLDHRIARSGVFRAGEAAACIAFVARGLEEAHVRGLVHRDLKPGNLFFALDDRGEVAPKVLDFGVSKATSDVTDPDMIKTNTGAVLGSPAYMSPEQARGELDIDGRSDVWSLGVILYEMLTGRAPFDGANYNALMVAILTTHHQSIATIDPSIPQDLSDLVDRCLEKDRTRRVGSARELADRLEELVQRITHTPYPLAGGRPRSLSPPREALTKTSGGAQTWSDSGRRDGKDRSIAVWISGATLAVAVASIGIVAATRQRPPQVAVAVRSAAIMVQALERTKETLATLTSRVDAHGPDEGLTIEPDALPPARPAPSASSLPDPSRPSDGRPESRPAQSARSPGKPAPSDARSPRGPRAPGSRPPKKPGVDDPGF